MNRAATEKRCVFVLAHTGREDAREVARQFCRSLHQHGLGVRLLKEEAADLDLDLEGLEQRLEVTTRAVVRELRLESEEDLFAHEAHLVGEDERRELPSRARREHQLAVARRVHHRAADAAEGLARRLALGLAFQQLQREGVRRGAHRLEPHGETGFGQRHAPLVRGEGRLDRDLRRLAVPDLADEGELVGGPLYDMIFTRRPWRSK